MSDKEDRPGFLERAEERVETLLHPKPAEKPKPKPAGAPADRHAAAHGPAPAPAPEPHRAPAPVPHPAHRTVKITAVELGSDGQTVVVWAEVAGKEYGVPFHKPDLDSMTNLDAKKQYVARQVLAAVAAGKAEPPAPPEDLALLGVVEVEEG